MSSPEDWRRGVKEIMHVKQLTQGLHSPQKSILSLKLKKKKFGLSFPSQENEDNASVAPISKSASEVTWNNVTTGNKNH